MSSTSSGNVHSVLCQLCGKYFSKRGIHIHIARSHRSSNDNNFTSTNVTPGSVQKDHTNESVCPYCGKYFLRISTHISRVHRDIYRQTVADRYQIIPSDTPSTTTTSNYTTTSVSIAHTKYINEINDWIKLFQSINLDARDESKFDCLVSDFIIFLKNATPFCKGPIHPAVKYYAARKNWKDNVSKTNYSGNKNPQRSEKRKREQRRQQYQYELTQHYYYYYRRKKAVQNIMNLSDSKKCPVPAGEISEYFSQMFTRMNTSILDHYPQPDTSPTFNFDCIVSEQDIHNAIKGMNVDTAPGSDKVLLKVVKELHCEKIISTIATIMLTWGFVPSGFKKGKTILIYKSGDPHLLSNWRPITIFSVLRRIIERAIEKKLRFFTDLSDLQRGFVPSPGAFINSSLINSTLQDAKKKNKNCTVLFLDVTKAFDSIGHSHIEHTLNSLNIPQSLRTLIINLLTDNSITIQVDAVTCTKEIKVSQGVPQGSPLSPLLFNLAIDFIFKEIGDHNISSVHGYDLIEHLDKLSIFGFADDLAIV